MDLLSDFLLSNFYIDNLYMPLFYRMQYALRFEIGDPSINTNKKVYIDNVYLKSLVLFKEVFDDEDEIYIVVNDVIFNEENSINIESKCSIENYIIKTEDKNACFDIRKHPYFYDDDLKIKSIQYKYKCRLNNVKYREILKAISNSDLGIKPSISYEVYFIHIEKQVIYQLYDDRGLDIASADRHILYSLYIKYNDWLLEYDKERMEGMIKNLTIDG